MLARGGGGVGRDEHPPAAPPLQVRKGVWSGLAAFVPDPSLPTVEAGLTRLLEATVLACSSFPRVEADIAAASGLPTAAGAAAAVATGGPGGGPGTPGAEETSRAPARASGSGPGSSSSSSAAAPPSATPPAPLLDLISAGGGVLASVRMDDHEVR